MTKQQLIRRLKKRREKLDLFWSLEHSEQCHVYVETLVALEETIEYLEKGDDLS